MRNNGKVIRFVFIPACFFVAIYCLIAGMAGGGSHTNRDGEVSYSAPTQHSREFYQGLRWSVTVCGSLVATAMLARNRRWGVLYVVLAMLFNPIAPIHLSKTTWESIDMLAFLAFLIASGVAWPAPEN
jgi:hypothetical protein